MSQFIKSMRGLVKRRRGYGQDGFELEVSISFDAAEFNRLKKTQDPLSVAMPQIKNIVLDACGVRGLPSYSPLSMHQRYPRAKGGLVTLVVYFDVSQHLVTHMGVNPMGYNVSQAIDLNSTLESTRTDGHLFAKSVLASRFGH